VARRGLQTAAQGRAPASFALNKSLQNQKMLIEWQIRLLFKEAVVSLLKGFALEETRRSFRKIQ
jgi:hypothetical protein